jgi:hypothetical protein
MRLLEACLANASAILNDPPVPPPQYTDAFTGGGPRLAGAAQQPRKKKGREKIAPTGPFLILYEDS